MALSTQYSPDIRGSSASNTSASRDVLGGAELVADVVEGAIWDELVVGFDTICQEQLFVYARGRWQGVDLEPVVFRQNRQVVGGVLVMLQPLPLRLGTIALIKWAPMLAKADAPHADGLMRAMVGYLKAEYGQRRGMMVSVMAAVEPVRENSGFARLLDMGFKPGAALRAPDRYVVDLRLDDEARMAAFGQKWRYHLRKALKGELNFEHGSAPDLPRFMQLYDAMSERKRFADHSAIATVSDLFTLPEGKGRPELFFVTKGEETVGGAIIFSCGLTATYLYGATSDAALDLRAGYFLHWHVIRWLRENTRARWYDLGGSDGAHGLHQFKSGMVGDAGFIRPLPPTANYAPNLRARLVGEGAYAARGAINRTRDVVDDVLRGLMRRLMGRTGR